MVTTLLSLDIREHYNHYGERSVTRVPTRRRSRLLNVLTTTNLRRNVSAFRTIRRGIKPSLRLGNNRLITTNFRLLFMAISLRLNSLISRPIRNLIRLHGLDITVVRAKTRQGFATTSPIRNTRRHHRENGSLLLRVRRSRQSHRRGGGDTRRRRSLVQHGIRPRVLMKGRVRCHRHFSLFTRRRSTIPTRLYRTVPLAIPFRLYKRGINVPCRRVTTIIRRGSPTIRPVIFRRFFGRRPRVRHDNRTNFLMRGATRRMGPLTSNTRVPSLYRRFVNLTQLTRVHFRVRFLLRLLNDYAMTPRV